MLINISSREFENLKAALMDDRRPDVERWMYRTSRGKVRNLKSDTYRRWKLIAQEWWIGDWQKEVRLFLFQLS